MERLIYALNCPVTGRTHYVGKTTCGMRRPKQHMTHSHNEKITEWVNNLKELGTAPVIIVLETVREEDDINERELYWIQRMINDGQILLNEFMVTPMVIDPNLTIMLNGPIVGFKKISEFIKVRRRAVKLSQEEFSNKTGISLKVIRKIEQGHTNITLDSLFKVLRAFGHTLDVTKITDFNVRT